MFKLTPTRLLVLAVLGLTSLYGWALWIWIMHWPGWGGAAKVLGVCLGGAGCAGIYGWWCLRAPPEPLAVRAPVAPGVLHVEGDYELMCLGGELFRRRRIREPGMFLAYRYHCPRCGTLLTAGPCGGAAVNAVCADCRINYGCLPAFQDN